MGNVDDLLLGDALRRNSGAKMMVNLKQPDGTEVLASIEQATFMMLQSIDQNLFAIRTALEKKGLGE